MASFQFSLLNHSNDWKKNHRCYQRFGIQAADSRRLGCSKIAPWALTNFGECSWKIAILLYKYIVFFLNWRFLNPKSTWQSWHESHQSIGIIISTGCAKDTLDTCPRKIKPQNLRCHRFQPWNNRNLGAERAHATCPMFELQNVPAYTNNLLKHSETI